MRVGFVSVGKKRFPLFGSGRKGSTWFVGGITKGNLLHPHLLSDHHFTHNPRLKSVARAVHAAIGLDQAAKLDADQYYSGLERAARLSATGHQFNSATGKWAKVKGKVARG
jgi:hypothetical protein